MGGLLLTYNQKGHLLTVIIFHYCDSLNLLVTLFHLLYYTFMLTLITSLISLSLYLSATPYFRTECYSSITVNGLIFFSLHQHQVQSQDCDPQECVLH